MSQENTQQIILDSPESPDTTQKLVIESANSSQQSSDTGEVVEPSQLTSTQITSPANDDEKRFEQENIKPVSNERFESPPKTRDEYINSFLEMCRNLDKQKYQYEI